MEGRSARPENAAPWINRAIETCLGLAIAVPTLVFGARQACGQLALAILVLAAFALWIAAKIGQGRPFISFRRPEVCLPLAAIALSMVTWIPFPASWIQTLSPAIGRLLPEWTDGSLGAERGWHTFSLAPGLSRDGTLLFVLYALLFWITLDTVRQVDSMYRILGILFVTGVAVAALGLLHYLFWNGKFYWLWEIWWVEPDRQVRAPFTNRNHFAGFLALALAPGAAVLLRVVRDWKKSHYYSSATSRRRRPVQEIKVLLIAGGLTLILAGILLAQSRGGLVVGLMVTAICIIGLIQLPSKAAQRTRLASGARSGAIERLQSRGRLFLASMIVVASLGLAVTFARQDPFQRTRQLLEGNQSLDELLNDRLKLWKADLAAVRDFPLLGTGPGSHQYVYPIYLNQAYRITFTHAENCYLQILMECGFAGALLLTAALFVLASWGWRALQHQRRTGSRTASVAGLAVTTSLLAALVHATVDFVWYVPAYAAALAVLAGMIRSLAHFDGQRGRGGEGAKGRQEESTTPSIFPSPPRPLFPSAPLRLIWGGALALTSVALICIVGQPFVQAAETEYAWTAYYRLISTDHQTLANSSGVEDRIHWLTAACEHGSVDPDHYLQLGLANLEMFVQKRKQAVSPAGLLQTRKVLQQGKFQDANDARAWLQSRYGDDLLLLEKAHAALSRSLTCCPLGGEAYLHLARLCFLDNPVRPEPRPYWQQAERVRPNDPDLYLQIGLEYWLTGDRDGARISWRRACALLPNCQLRLLPFLAERLPVRQVVEILPVDFEGLKWLTLTELKKGQKEAATFAARKAQAAVENNTVQAKNPAFWLAAHDLYQKVELPSEAEACLRKALHLAPDRLGIHVLLIRWLMEQAKWREALAEAQNARQQFPDKPDIQALINDILALKVPWAQAKEDHQGPRIDDRKLPESGARSSLFDSRSSTFTRRVAPKDR